MGAPPRGTTIAVSTPMPRHRLLSALILCAVVCAAPQVAAQIATQEDAEDGEPADPLSDPLMEDPLMDDPLFDDKRQEDPPQEGDGGDSADGVRASQPGEEADEDGGWELLDPRTWARAGPVVVPGLRPDASVVYTADELKLRGYRTLGEALRDVAGLFRFETARGVRYVVRGIPDGIALLVDGVPLVVDGERDLLDVDRGLNLDDIASVEIIRGPTSALTGVTSLGGVVHVRMKTAGVSGARASLSASMIGAPDDLPTAPAGPTSVDLGAFGGPMVFGDRWASADGTVRLGELGVLLTASARQGPSRLWRLEGLPTSYIQIGNGFIPGALTDRNVLAGDEQSATARASVTYAQVRVDALYSHQLEAVPLSRTTHGLLLPNPDTERKDRLVMRAFFDDDFGPLRVSGAVWGGRHEREQLLQLFPARGSFPDGGSALVTSETLLAGARLRLDLSITQHHRVSAGAFADVHRLQAASDIRAPQGGLVSENLVTLNDLTGTGSVAAEYQGVLPYGFGLTAGLVARVRTAFAPALAPRLALSWAPAAWLSMRAAYAEGTRAPDRYDMAALSQIIIVGDALRAGEAVALSAEHVRSVELGLRFSPSARLRVDVDVYGSRHENAIEDAVATDDMPQAGQVVPTNLPPRHVLGGELTTHLEAVEGLLDVNAGVWGAACVLGPDLDTDLFRAFLGMELRPLSGVTVGGRLRALARPSFRASVAVHEALDLDDTWVGPTPERSPLADGVFGTVDLYARYRTPGGAFTLGAAVQNALDGDEPVPSVAVLDLAPALSLPAPGRTVFLTLEGEM